MLYNDKPSYLGPSPRCPSVRSILFLWDAESLELGSPSPGAEERLLPAFVRAGDGIWDSFRLSTGDGIETSLLPIEVDRKQQTTDGVLEGHEQEYA
ncbi:hypothetical protein MKZ38_003696 [Zalerion maritima]|uniref:Uncharacterized protein n=1 Tax=Zalerion maritima TaxID=339359 RepID=A0AAD5RWS9_9PEZI|nr:hypothetical protein MKZ38_003696 [Zalerion maritima]